MKGVSIFLADGFEDVEALATNDVLRRGGVSTNLVAISDDPFVVSSHGITMGVECSIHDIDLSDHKGTDARDVMIFPGGMPGTKNLAACKPLMKAMKAHYAAGGTVAAICAAPGLVLGQLGEELEGVEFTCFDSFEEIPQTYGAKFIPKPAITCGRVITGRSAGHAIAFGLEVLAKVKGDEVAAKVEYAMNLKTV